MKLIITLLMSTLFMIGCESMPESMTENMSVDNLKTKIEEQENKKAEEKAAEDKKKAEMIKAATQKK